MAYDSDFQNICFVDLFEFEYQEGGFERFTSFTKPITFLTNVFQPAPIQGDEQERESSVKVGIQRVSIGLSDYMRTVLDLNRIKNRRILDRGKYRLYQAELGNEDSNYRLKFAGSTGKVEASRAGLEMEFRDVFFTLKKNVPSDIYAEQCNNVFGDPVTCTVDWDAIKVVGAAQAGSTDKLLIDSGRSELDGYFTRGKLQMTTGALAGEESSIQEYTTGQFKLMPPFSDAIAIGDQYTAWPNCQKAFGGCQGFVNEENFFGFRHVPRPEQM